MKKHLLILLLLLPVLAQAQIRNIVARYPIDGPSMEKLNDGIIGRWKFKEDTNKNNFYEIIRKEPYYLDRYHLKFWNRGGTNPTYESNMHFSKIGDVQFINVPYFETNENERSFSHKGFFFLRILAVNQAFTKMTVAVIHDTNLWDLDEDGVRQRLMKNLDNPAYYSDTVHFYKIK